MSLDSLSSIKIPDWQFADVFAESSHLYQTSIPQLVLIAKDMYWLDTNIALVAELISGGCYKHPNIGYFDASQILQKMICCKKLPTIFCYYLYLWW